MTELTQSRPSRAQRAADRVLLGLTEAATVLDIHPQTLRKMAQQNEIPCFKMRGGNGGGRWKFRKEDLSEWIEKEINRQGE